jgi:CMP-N-acetylneuraminic acid synthetase
VRIVAVIPARGGSKGITRKNLRRLGSDSLLGLKIKQAKSSLCDEIYISTEDYEISNEGLIYGAKVIPRPLGLAQDETSTDLVLLHAVESLELKNTDILVLLQATSPFLEHEKIDTCIEKLRDSSDLNSVITLRFGHPFMWKDSNGKIEPVGHSRERRPRRQDLGVEGWETGGCYAIRVSALRDQGVRYPKPTAAVGVNQIEALDIDTIEDLEVAHLLAKVRNRGN